MAGHAAEEVTRLAACQALSFWGNEASCHRFLVNLSSLIIFVFGNEHPRHFGAFMFVPYLNSGCKTLCQDAEEAELSTPVAESTFRSPAEEGFRSSVSLGR